MKLFWVWPGSLPEQTASSVLATGHFIVYTMPTFMLLNQPYIWLKMTSSEIAEPASLLLATGSPTGAPNVVACRLTGHICTVGHLRKTTEWISECRWCHGSTVIPKTHLSDFCHIGGALALRSLQFRLQVLLLSSQLQRAGFQIKEFWTFVAMLEDRILYLHYQSEFLQKHI